MAGISSRHGKFGIAKQTAKGSPAASPTTVYYFAGSPSLAPVKERQRFPMTDSGRDQAAAYTSSMHISGDVPLYLHPDGFGLLALLALGSSADAGTGPYTHTATPAADVPYFTCWRSVGPAGSAIYEKFTDCKLNQLRIEGQAGGPLIATLSLMGISSTFETSDMTGSPLTSTPYIYPQFLGELKVDTVAQKIHRLSIGVDNGLSPYQADDLFWADIDPGARAVTCSFSTRFTGPTAFPKYREFFYGSDSGTTLTGTTGTHAFAFKVVQSASASILFSMPQVTYSAVPVNPDTSGNPIEVEVATEVEKPSGGNIITITTTDSVATW